MNRAANPSIDMVFCENWLAQNHCSIIFPMKNWHLGDIKLILPQFQSPPRAPSPRLSSACLQRLHPYETARTPRGGIHRAC